jgi:hypothetical protein
MARQLDEFKMHTEISYEILNEKDQQEAWAEVGGTGTSSGGGNKFGKAVYQTLTQKVSIIFGGDHHKQLKHNF